MTRLWITIILTMFLFSCSSKNDPIDHSLEYPPGDELAGQFALKPSYHNEWLTITPDGKVEFKIEDNKKITGLAYKNKFRLIVFLDQDVDPTGIFLLTDRTNNEWPGVWKGETRFLQLKNNHVHNQ
ncbi:MAG: hypothetical protein H3C43_02160 [Leptonema sp. (in: Bacteria)]|nr:hypothetical protein [Leptonema sp. (in: bacteria)]